MVFLYILQPLFEKLANRMPRRTLLLISGALAVLMAIDCLFTFLL